VAPMTVLGSASGSSTSDGLSNASPLRTSPITIPRRSSTIAISSESTTSTTPPTTDSQSLFSPESISTSSSYPRPYTDGSNASSTRNHPNTGPRTKDTTPPPLHPAPNANDHGKSVPRNVVRPQRRKRGRPATSGEAEASPSRLSRIGELHDEIGGKSEPRGASSSLPSSFVALEHASSRPALDVAPSEGSKTFYMSSWHLPPSSANDDMPGADPLYIKYGSDEVVEAATLPGLVGRLIYDSAGVWLI
jgi:hypothetical protein